MNKKIEKLTATLNEIESHSQKEIQAVKASLQVEYNKVFDKDTDLQKAISAVQCSSEYGADENGIYAWTRYYIPSEFKENDTLIECLDTYLSDQGFTLDVTNDALMLNCGDDNLIIQDDTRHDNGVWQGHKLVIKESEYKTEDEDGRLYVDESKRNKLIEQHMEKIGYFPGVFRIDYHGNVFPVNTQETK
jgi:hypothetical protein